ncbi:MAG: GAF domain-containing protein [Pseudonocardiaceae bacterium]
MDTGPCLQALASGEVVDAPDLGVESRWQGYPAIAMGHGILGVYSVPLIVAGKPVGVLNLCARTRHALHAVDRQLAALLAGQAAIAVTAARRHYDEVTLSDHLRIALSPDRSSTRPSASSWSTNGAPPSRPSPRCGPSRSAAAAKLSCMWPAALRAPANAGRRRTTTTRHLPQLLLVITIAGPSPISAGELAECHIRLTKRRPCRSVPARLTSLQ